MSKVCQQLRAAYASLGHLADDDDGACWEIRHRLDKMARLPSGSAHAARLLLEALRNWNACYDPETGHLRGGAPREHDRMCAVASAEARLLIALGAERECV